ncbi:MAG: Dabb family protein [Bacteroidota bacterium]
MIKHIVMWKIKKNVDELSKEKNLKKMKSMLEELKEKISVIHALEVGCNFNPSTMAYDIVLYSEFRNKDDLETYQKHPDHVRVSDFVGSIRESRAVVDYEM